MHAHCIQITTSENGGSVKTKATENQISAISASYEILELAHLTPSQLSLCDFINKLAIEIITYLNLKLNFFFLVLFFRFSFFI